MAKPAPNKDMTWDEAIRTVLQTAEGALHYTDIAERISSMGVKHNVGPNPKGSVAAVLSRSLEDDNSPFQKVGKGEYALKDKLRADILKPDSSLQEEPEGAETGALRAFGMFWQRENVIWSGKPKLLGRQQLGATDVDFCEQVGVYLLHDQARVIYVGRASDTLYTRLKAHTGDRLGGRWSRFSWFGLRSVGSNAELLDPSEDWSHSVVIETLEALLIESLEPPLNRRRGDNFSGVEYLQVIDPEIENVRKRQVISEMMKLAGLASS